MAYETPLTIAEVMRDISKNNERFAIYSLCESDTMLFAAPLFVSIKQR